ncbi:MAG TPA: hypothetical protein VL442_09685 [Mucilaginibacter sp.]|nr:hypothetical protein [Mucilaginibacter sp.]
MTDHFQLNKPNDSVGLLLFISLPCFSMLDEAIYGVLDVFSIFFRELLHGEEFIQ